MNKKDCVRKVSPGITGLWQPTNASGRQTSGNKLLPQTRLVSGLHMAGLSSASHEHPVGVQPHGGAINGDQLVSEFLCTLSESASL